MQPKTVYKSLRSDYKSPVRLWDWKPYLPAKTAAGEVGYYEEPGPIVQSDGLPSLCHSGFHGWLTLERAKQEGAHVYEMEITGDIEQDHEKATGKYARLLRHVWSKPVEPPFVPYLEKHGIRNCQKCGKPHDGWVTQKNMAPQWGADGHSYAEEPWEDWAKRELKNQEKLEIEIYDRVRKELRAEYKGPGTYDPVVPAAHGPFKAWKDNPHRCGTCGLSEFFHEGWEARDKIADEFKHYDRWQLLWEIQRIRNAVNQNQGSQPDSIKA